MAILRNMADAILAALADGGVGDVVPHQGDLAARQRLQARQAVNQLGLAVAVDAGDAHDFALAHIKGYAAHGVVLVQLGGDRHVFHLQDHLAGRFGLLFHMEIDAAAHHHGRQLLHGSFGGIDRTDIFALAQHGAAIGYSHDFSQLMGNEQDRLALLSQVAHDLHQLVDLVRGKHGGGLVEDQDIVIAVEHLENFGSLLHAHGDVLNLRVQIDVQAVALAQGVHLFAGLSLIEEAEFARLRAQDDIIQHRKALHQLEMLMHHADAQGVGVVGVADHHVLAIDADFALLRLIQAEKHAHQRGFACAVLAQKRVNFTLAQLQGDIVVCDDARKSLGDMQHFYGVFVPVILQGICPSLTRPVRLARPLTKTPASFPGAGAFVKGR